MRHDAAWQLLPNLLVEPDGASELRRHVARCHDCQRQLFLLQRVEQLLRSRPPLATPRRRASRTRRICGLAASAIVAVALVVVLAPPLDANADELTFRSSAGPGVVVRGAVEHGDSSGAVLTIVASGLPDEFQSHNFLVWARAASGTDSLIVGRFMANPRGECTARFDLPGTLRWAHFWITPDSSPARVVAATTL